MNPGVEYMIASVLDFQTDGETPFWSSSLYHFFPEIDQEAAQRMAYPERCAYIAGRLCEVYRRKEAVIEEKVAAYHAHWRAHRAQAEAAFSQAFGLDCSVLINDMVCKVSLNPVSPRFLEAHAFEVFYLNSERGALGMALHEMTHFLWFHVWHEVFRDSPREYERPHLKWVLSEMVVEPILSDPSLVALNPYYPRERGGCVYPYFYDMIISGECILDTLHAMYRRRSDIQGFMRESYA